MKVLSVLFVLFLFISNAYSYTASDWLQNMNGYEKAMAQVKGQEKPLILFFHVDWCGWCKRLKKNLLTDYEVTSFLAGYTKVAINPETSSKEKELFKKYGGTGYPTFLVYVPDFGKNHSNISGWNNKKQKTGKEFVDSIKAKIAREFNNKAYTFNSSSQYEEAIKYYEVSLNLDVNNITALMNSGYAHSQLYKTNRLSTHKDKSKTYYKRVLQINPDNKMAERNLKSLEVM